MSFAESLADRWRVQLQNDYPNHSQTTHESIIQWLLGQNSAELDNLTPTEQSAFEQGVSFRYRVLQQRYLDISPEQAYRNLMKRLGGLVILRQKIRAWVATSRDRQRNVIDVLQEVIQEMLNSDRYLQQQLQWIAECTTDSRLRNSLLLTSLEEYCLRPIRNQPLLVYRFVNYLRRSQRGGLTQVPTGEWVRQVSEEIISDETEERVSLLEEQALTQHEETQYLEEQQLQRLTVQTEFETYLRERVDPVAAEWLQLYLKGESQEAIAKLLNLPIKQVYRLREKVSYHAVRNFALKHAPELVDGWLGTSLSEHRLGLTPSQWEEYWESLNPMQRQLIADLKAGQTLEAIAKNLKLKTTQVLSEWTKLYLNAQAIRNR
ncbi:HetZ-related protein 2 [Capilliphycus salinus ALCB114379]|uniref:HetZ-related protein 2 n=1 Tax=Capilliphycus salinus TaxID=2768948 RepID=UPI0039A6326E